MKIPFDADEFETRLERAANNLNDLMLGLPTRGHEYLRLDDKQWVVEVCLAKFRRSGVAKMNARLDVIERNISITPGTREGINLVRGYLNEYEWSE